MYKKLSLSANHFLLQLAYYRIFLIFDLKAIFLDEKFIIFCILVDNLIIFVKFRFDIKRLCQ